MTGAVYQPPKNKVQELQRTLYRAAKADPRRRFHALYDKVYRRDILERAWEQVRRNRGAAGIDGVTLAEVERYGVERLLDELAAELKEASYRVQPSRRVWIPKPGRSEQRPLSIPSVRDRIVQASLKLVMEPVFEAGFLPSSFGFRPKLAAHDALQVLVDEAWQGRRWVVETDIASCFEAIPHDRLMAAVEERICDRKILKLVRAMLRAGVMESGVVKHSVTGTPQGGVISPLLANVYLHRLDREWEARRVLACWCATRMTSWCSAGAGRKRSGHWPSCATCWMSSVWSSRRRRRASCTCGREARGSISSASNTAGYVRSATSMSSSSRAGPHGERCSGRGTASVNSRRGRVCC